MGKPGAMKSTGLGTMTEREWQKMVTDYCEWLHLRHYHTYDSRRSVAGFPDLVIVGRRVVFAELKSVSGKLSLPQRDWLVDLRLAGADAYVWRPSDWPQVQELLKSLAGR